MVFLSWGRPSSQQQKACIHKSGTFNYEDKYKGATAKSMSSLKDDKGLSKDGFLLNNVRVLVGSGVDTFEKGKNALRSWRYAMLSLIVSVSYFKVTRGLMEMGGVNLARHFGLNWAFVDPKTPIQQGVKFCVCVKELLPWVMMPLQVVYVNETSTAKNRVASFGFGSGTLHGHLLHIKNKQVVINKVEFDATVRLLLNNYEVRVQILETTSQLVGAGEERFSVEIDENNQVWYEILSFSKPTHILSFVGYPYVILRQKYFAHESAKLMQKHINSSKS
ncbi:hypothetical protein Lal_00012157 [Lupinus albus]|nr:hypothetical protein Lal_00012157 [Lupinus albus]